MSPLTTIGPRSRVAALFAATALALLAGTTGAVADDQSRNGEIARLGDHLRRSPRLLGDPGGARSDLQSAGLAVQLFFDTFFGAKVRGGSQPDDAYRNSGSYDLFAFADMEELGGFTGLSLFLQAKGNYGRNINPRVAALSDPIDDADFDEPIYLAQLWAQRDFLDERIRVRAGYQDQQTVFDRNAFANGEDVQFLSTFLDNNPVVPLKIGLAATVLIRPAEWLELAAATADADNAVRDVGFDTTFDGFASLNGYLEADLRGSVSSRRGDLAGGYRLGVFLDNSEKQELRPAGTDASPQSERGHLGGYLSLDQMVLRESPDDLQGLGLFARFGVADDRVNEIARFWSFGLQYLGALPSRRGDVLGLALYQTIPSDRDGAGRARETGVELYYRIDVLPWLVLTPDFQFVVDPGGSASGADAIVVALRARVAM